MCPFLIHPDGSFTPQQFVKLIHMHGAYAPPETHLWLKLRVLMLNKRCKPQDVKEGADLFGAKLQANLTYYLAVRTQYFHLFGCQTQLVCHKLYFPT